LEKDAEARLVETQRYKTIRFWTIVAAVAGIIAAVGSIIAAWPVLKGS
jgi:fatty acid desaturase